MEIKPYSKNAKKHPDKQLKRIAESLKNFGWQQTIVVDKNNEIIVGHGRWFAYEKYKDEMKLPEPEIKKASNLTKQQVKAYRLADNRLNESDWDMELAIEELKELDEKHFDLTGFDSDLIIEPDDKDDEVPEVPEEPKSKLGEIYQLGSHRIMCGDSTKQEDVEKLMDGQKADMSFTSPPYNVGHNLGYDKKSKYENSDDDLDNYIDLIVKSTQLSLEYANEVFVNIQFLANNKKDILLWLAELSERFKDIFFWKKLQVAPQYAERVANTQTEIIVLFGHNNNRAWGNKKWRGNFSNSIETKSASGENKNAKIHNATFPVDLPLKFITQGYKENSIILDLFIGTGSTLIACEKTNRVCYGMELDCRYVDTCVERWCRYTGITDIKKNGKDYKWELQDNK